MTLTNTELESRAIELSAEAFEGFCEDISGMFEVDMKCVTQQACEETIAGLKKRFKKLSAINNVDAVGTMLGTYYLIFDQAGLFTLSGVIVMLPENRIIQEIRRGTIQDVDSMNDAVGEIGNLCVGSWDRVFREEYEGHGHFVQNGTFIGNPWENPQEIIKLNKDESLIFCPFEMTVGNFPTFKCGVIFPKSIFAHKSESDSEIHDEKKDELDHEKGTEPISIEISKTDSEEDQQTEIDNTQENETNTDNSETIKKITQSHADLPEQTVSLKKDIPTQQTQARTESEIASISLSAKDIMETSVTWCSSEESVQQAIEKMRQDETGYLLVGNEGVLEGIVSRSDITGAMSPYLRAIFSKWRRPLDNATLNIKIKWIMNRPVYTIKTDTNITKVMENMMQHGVRCFPVIDSNSKIQGIVTVFDIFKALNTNSDVTTFGKTNQVPLLI